MVPEALLLVVPRPVVAGEARRVFRDAVRAQIEELADLWQFSEQLRRRDALICDAQTACPGACRGWNEFTDRDLEGFCLELLGRRISIRAQTKQTDRIVQLTESKL